KEPEISPEPRKTPVVKKDTKPDPIRQTLDQARVEYRAEVDKLRVQLLASLDAAEEVARTSGNGATVDQIKDERDGYLKEGTLPTVVPTKEFHQQLNQAVRTAIAAHRAAITEYQRTMKDAAAAALERDPFFEELLRLEPVDLIGLLHTDKDA